MTNIHVSLYRLTKGRLGGRMAGGDILLLTTTGRKSGKTRTVPTMYLRDGENYLVAGSAGGRDRHPGWYWNATKGTHPVQIQVRDQVTIVKVTEAEGAQRDILYQRFIDMFQGFEGHQTKTKRTIPVLILTPEA